MPFRSVYMGETPGGGDGIATAFGIGKVTNDDRFDCTSAYALFPGHMSYFWHAVASQEVLFGEICVLADWKDELDERQSCPHGNDRVQVIHTTTQGRT